MKCPNCNINLQMTDRQGIGIDYCPQCRGVWLDRGELDKLIERSTPREPEWEDSRSAGGSRVAPGNRQEYRGRKKGFWREIFDFD